MKSRSAFTSVEDTTEIVFRSDIEEQKRRKTEPSLAEIRERAFEIHIARGGIHGWDLNDWLKAERELFEKYEEKDRAKRKK